MEWHSFSSDISNQTSGSSASLEMLLHERQMDPEVMLLDLGFGGQGHAAIPAIARVPLRFLNHPSETLGISISNSKLCGEIEEGSDSYQVPAVEVADHGHASWTPQAKAKAAEEDDKVPAGHQHHLKPKTGMRTVARTVSTLLSSKSAGHQGHPTMSSLPVGVPPGSILSSANQMYLVNTGYYQLQGWPQESPICSTADTVEGMNEVFSKNAASKRQMFKKTKSKLSWSLCDPDEEEKKESKQSPYTSEWITKSLDDSLAFEDSEGLDDSSSKFQYFSTTTESSTDSIEDRNSERALEEIRQQCRDAQLSFSSQYKSSAEQDKLENKDSVIGVAISKDLTNQENQIDCADEICKNHGKDLLGVSEDRDDIGSKYFISPANSRQGTVEKCPLILEPTPAVDYVQGRDDYTNLCSSNNNNNNNDIDSPDCARGVLLEKINSNVQIVVSNSSEFQTEPWSEHCVEESCLSSSLGVYHSVPPPLSDSGSNSSGTAVGACSGTTAADDLFQDVNDSENCNGDENNNNDPSNNSLKDDSKNKVDDVYSLQSKAEVFLNSYGNPLSSSQIIPEEDTAEVVFNFSRNSTVQAANSSGQTGSPTTLGRLRLSSLPTAINPIQLMKQLHHSQDKFLPRMGSVQSDSSGFLDGDCAPDSCLVDEGSTIKTKSVGKLSQGPNLLKTTQSEKVDPNLPTTPTYISTYFIPPKASKDTNSSVKNSKGFLSSRISQSKTPHQEEWVAPAYFTPGRARKAAGGYRNKLSGLREAEDVFNPTWKDYDPRKGVKGVNDVAEDVEYWHQMNLSSQGLSVNPRNQTPLFEELATASRCHAVRSTPNISSSPLSLQVNESPKLTRSFTSGANTDRRQNRVVTSMSVYVGQDGTPRNSMKSNDRLTPKFGSLTPGKVVKRAENGQTTSAKDIPVICLQDDRLNESLMENEDLLRAEVESLPAGFDANTFEHFGLEEGGSFHGMMHDFQGLRYSEGSSCKMPSVFSPYHEGRGSVTQGSSSSRNSISSAPPLSTPRHEFSEYSSRGRTVADRFVRHLPSGKKNGILDSQKLARLINRPSSSKRVKNRQASYQPGRRLQDWQTLSRQKRLWEEDNLLQHSIHKYRAELSILESAFLSDFGQAVDTLTDEERETIQEVDWLFGEVKEHVRELETLVNSRIQSVHAGNEFHSLLSSLGVINRTIELIKEQIFLQQVADQSSHSSFNPYSGIDMSEDSIDLEAAEQEQEGDSCSSHSSVLSPHSLLDGSVYSSPPYSWTRSRGHSGSDKMFQSSSVSSLPSMLNQSFEQMRSSLVKEMKDEIRKSTQELEDSLLSKTREIEELKNQLLSQQPSANRRPSTQVKRRQQSRISRSRPRVLGDLLVRETDI